MALHIAALGSGTGSNIAAIIKSITSGRLEARIRLVASDRPDAPLLDKAKEHGLPVWAEAPGAFANRDAYNNALLDAVKGSGADTVVLAGYMRLLPPQFIREFRGRILNIHPSLLPSFPGKIGAHDALEYGVRFTGATVHFVDEGMDSGPIIIQAALPLGVTDTEQSLMPRIHAVEHRIYPQALQWLAQNRLEVDGRRVVLKPGRFPVLGSTTVHNPGMGTPWMISPPLEEGF